MRNLKFNIPEVSDVILNRYIKGILKRLSEDVPLFKKTEITKLTMRERAMEERGDVKFMRNEDDAEAELPIST